MSDLFSYSCIATNLEMILLIIVLAGFPVGVLPGLECGGCNDDVWRKD